MAVSGGSPLGTPQEQTPPWGQTTPGADPHWDQASPWDQTPPSPTDQAPPMWTESQTSVKTLPCPNFVAGGKNPYDQISMINDLFLCADFCCCKSLHSRKSFVLGELSFARMPSRQYCLKVNKLHCWNCRPELVNCGQ